jgi:hypothetical protein
VQVDPALHFAPSDPGWQTYSFVTTREPRDLGRPPPLCREWWAWARARDGVDADQTRVYVYLQGKPGTAVLITGLSVEFVSRAKPERGTHAYCPAGGAVASPRLVDIDLDTRPPDVRYAQPGDDFPARRRLPLTLTGAETEVIELVAHTRRCDCEWRARLQVVVDGERDEVVIDNNGEPFRTVASRRSAHHQWVARWKGMSQAEWKRTLPMRWARFNP